MVSQRSSVATVYPPAVPFDAAYGCARRTVDQRTVGAASIEIRWNVLFAAAHRRRRYVGRALHLNRSHVAA
jgi:hypothetical protein